MIPPSLDPMSYHYSCATSSDKHLNQREAVQSNDGVEALVSVSLSQKTARGD